MTSNGIGWHGLIDDRLRVLREVGVDDSHYVHAWLLPGEAPWETLDDVKLWGSRRSSDPTRPEASR